MPELLTVLLLTLGAGLAMPLGALGAHIERIQPRWLEREVRHGIVAFGGGAYLLAALIALQNLPEGFNAYREMRAGTGGAPGSTRLLATFLLLALLGPVAGGAGYAWLSGAHGLVAAIMIFAAGGILYAVFEDIAPQAHMENEWAPPLGAVLGFVLGVAGHLLTSGG